ncbi:MAG: phosphoribosylaminoimidazolesuccinocarboxamide synthase [Gammaproteobacteria bacterium]|nr:phosphoribosylaminoimidazolesuccinocarboxamide synthase [Gammaproteobacteria bacterium]
MTAEPLYRAELESLPRVHGGKVRDIFAVDEAHWLIVTSDRLSAFDVIFPDPIPGKGEVLTDLSRFWFEATRDLVPNHLAAMTLHEAVPDQTERALIATRAMVVRKFRALPVEAVVRGYLAGSGWKDYQREGGVCGQPLPQGLRLADRLPEPIFTPATKAEEGEHDENISFAACAELIGRDLAEQVRGTAFALYRFAAEHARMRGIIIADTKFEFGVDERGGLVLIDEALTPDSSRFWPVADWQPGASPPSFDKQYVRDWVEASGWDKRPPAPALPAEVIAGTAERYDQARRRIIHRSA